MKTMRACTKYLILILALATLLMAFTSVACAADAGDAAETTADGGQAEASDSSGMKALAAGLTVGLAAAAGAIGMGIAIAKSVEGISRQPEAESKIRTSLMLGLVFVETAIIYALIIAVLIFILYLNHTGFSPYQLHLVKNGYHTSKGRLYRIYLDSHRSKQLPVGVQEISFHTGGKNLPHSLPLIPRNPEITINTPGIIIHTRELPLDIV